MTKKTWTYEVDKTKNILKNNEFISEDGEVIKLHNKTLENVAMNIVNYKEDEEEKRQNIKRYYYDKECTENEIVNKLGNFYFSFYNNLPKIEKQYLFRFIFMSTYIKYEDNRMMLKEDNNRYRLIKESEIQELLKLGRAEYFKTKKALIDNNLIFIDDKDNIHINNKISKIGNIDNNKKDYIRMFKNTIRNIYNNSLAREHKRLFVFIDLLPYVNYNLNIICFNPCEVNPELVEVMTIEDIQEVLKGKVDKNKSRLKNILLNTFIRDEKAMLIVKDFEKEFLVVNPKFYYKGNRIEDLNYLSNLFSV